MVRSLLGMTEIPEPAHAADALAVALCHMQHEQFRVRFEIPAMSGVKSSRLLRGRNAPRASHALAARIQPPR
jgi:hypothetical protein